MIVDFDPINGENLKTVTRLLPVCPIEMFSRDVALELLTN